MMFMVFMVHLSHFCLNLSISLRDMNMISVCDVYGSFLWLLSTSKFMQSYSCISGMKPGDIHGISTGY